MLAAARQVFMHEGYAEAGVTDIVAQAGASVGSLYHHFSGKADLYLALFEPLLRSLAGGLAFPPGQVLDVFVPGIMVLIAFGAGMGAGWPVIWELDSGVIERLRVTPASRLALLLGTVIRDIVMFVVPAIVVLAIATVTGFHAHPLAAHPSLHLRALDLIAAASER